MPTDREIEAAAKALYELEPNINSLGIKTEWHNLEQAYWCPYYRNKAKAALEAAEQVRNEEYKKHIHDFYERGGIIIPTPPEEESK